MTGKTTTSTALFHTIERIITIACQSPIQDTSICSLIHGFAHILEACAKCPRPLLKTGTTVLSLLPSPLAIKLNLDAHVQERTKLSAVSTEMSRDMEHRGSSECSGAITANGYGYARPLPIVEDLMPLPMSHRAVSTKNRTLSFGAQSINVSDPQSDTK